MSSFLLRLTDDYPKESELDNFPELEQNSQWFLMELQMLLTTRPRLLDEQRHLVDDNVRQSVVNYGINDTFDQLCGVEAKINTMQERLAFVITHFEPRLKGSAIAFVEQNDVGFLFLLSGELNGQKRHYLLSWDKALQNVNISETINDVDNN